MKRRGMALFVHVTRCMYIQFTKNIDSVLAGIFAFYTATISNKTMMKCGGVSDLISMIRFLRDANVFSVVFLRI